MTKRVGLQGRLPERHAQQAFIGRMGLRGWQGWCRRGALAGVHRQRHLLFAVLGTLSQLLRVGRCGRPLPAWPAAHRSRS